MSDISWSLLPVSLVFAADKAEALEAGKELFPGHRVTGGAQGGRARYLVPTAAGPPEKE